MRFDLVTIVWGEDYIDFFTGTILPCLLHSGNLADLSERGDVHYTLITTESDRSRLERSVSFGKLQHLAKIQWRTFSLEKYGTDKGRRYRAIAEQTQQYFDSLRGSTTCVSYLSPDAILSAGTLANAADRLRAGKRAVMLLGLRAEKEPFVASIRRGLTDDSEIDFSARSLCKHFLAHLHPVTKATFWDARESLWMWPSALIWPVGDEGVVTHAFHLHPIMLKLDRDFPPAPNSTLDGALVRTLCQTRADIHVVQDSDEAYGVELSARDHLGEEIRSGSYCPDAIAKWANLNADPFHWAFFKTPIRQHAGGLNSLWNSVEKEAQLFVRKIRLSAVRARIWLRTAPPPVAIGEFPKDVADPTLKSSGIFEDGWVSPTASCFLTQPGGDPLVVRGMLPQVGAHPIASEVRICVDGQEVLRKVLRPGSVDLTCPVASASTARRVEFQFSHAIRLAAPDTRSIGMLLTYLGFTPERPTG